MPSNLEILIAARAAIAEPQKWAIGSRFTSDGARCALGAVDCAIGAAKAETHPATLLLYAALSPDQKARARKRLREFFGCRDDDYQESAVVAQFNNTGTHAEVIELFDRAISIERAKERGTDISVFMQMLNAAAVPETVE